MKILSCVWRSYYGDPRAVNPNYYYMVEIPRRMGLRADYFDHVEQARLNKDSMNDLFLSTLRGGGFDLVLIETLQDEFYPEVLEEAKKYAATVAFNSDDDFRWCDYSEKWAAHYTYVLTTYRHIYEAVKTTHSNVLLFQWACGGFYTGLDTVKDINLSFVGGIHADRARRFAELQKHVPLEIFGRGTQNTQVSLSSLGRIISHKARGGKGTRQALRVWMLQSLGAASDSVTYEEANLLWNRTKVSFTPLNLSQAQYKQKLEMAKTMGKYTKGGYSPWTTPFQIKGRLFELGLSGTLVLCDRNPALDEYYDRGKEYEDFVSLEECVDKIKYFLKHETERRQIAQAYYHRTKREHVWKHRYERLFKEVGMTAK